LVTVTYSAGAAKVPQLYLVEVERSLVEHVSVEKMPI
jgi:hypothetical protein